MWETIKKYADQFCAYSFGLFFGAYTRMWIGIGYEAIDYVVRGMLMGFLPLSAVDAYLNFPYLAMCILLAGRVGLFWGLWDAASSMFPFPVPPPIGPILGALADIFPGLSVAVIKIARGYEPDPVTGEKLPFRPIKIFERSKRKNGTENDKTEKRRARLMEPVESTGCGCFSPSFLLPISVLSFLLCIGSAILWGHAEHRTDYYQEQAWESVKQSPRGVVENLKNNSWIAPLKPWLKSGKDLLADRWEELNKSWGIRKEEPLLKPEDTRDEELYRKAIKELKLEENMAKLYASKITTDKAKEMQEEAIAYYSTWFWRWFIVTCIAGILYLITRRIATSKRLQDRIAPKEPLETEDEEEYLFTPEQIEERRKKGKQEEKEGEEKQEGNENKDTEKEKPK